MDRPSHLIDAPSVGAAGDALGHPRAVTLGSADVSAHRGVGFCFLGAAVALRARYADNQPRGTDA